MGTSIIISLNAGIKPCLFAFKGWGFFNDGVNIPRYFDANQGFKLQHKNPTTAITASESSAGSMSGVYKYFYTEFNQTSGEADTGDLLNLHHGHETNPSPIYTTGTLSSKKVVLTLPGTAVNTGFTHLKIYATEAGGTTYYYIGSVAIGTTTYDDNADDRDENFPFGRLTDNADGTTTQSYLNYPIVTRKFLIPLKNKLMAFGAKEYSTGTVTMAASTSVAGSGTSWTTAMQGMTLYVSGLSRGYLIKTVTNSTTIVLEQAYAGATGAGKSYVITSDDSIVQWSAQNPLTAKSMWWAWPMTGTETSQYRRVLRWDPSPLMGGGIIEDRAVLFKQGSHVLMTENGNDYLDTESNTKVGTGSHWSIVNDPDDSSLYFLTPAGKVYKTNGLEAQDLLIDLSRTVDGINLTPTYLENSHGSWYDEKKWYMLAYPKEDATANDRMLVYEKTSGNWVIWKIRANCMARIEDSASNQEEYKPWIGTVGGFVYKTNTGNNFGASTSSGTIEGTTTSLGAATLTDSTATFYTTGDGLKDVYVSRFTSAGVFIEEQKISSNTGTIITVDTSWVEVYQTGETYEVGSIRWDWKSKIFDFGSDKTKCFRSVLLNFKKESTSKQVKITLYMSYMPDMTSATESEVTFDMSYSYFDPLSFYDNRFRYYQFKISGHGANDAVTINNVAFDIQEYKR